MSGDEKGEAPTTYEAEQIKVLEGLEPKQRERPEPKAYTETFETLEKLGLPSSVADEVREFLRPIPPDQHKGFRTSVIPFLPGDQLKGFFRWKVGTALRWGREALESDEADHRERAFNIGRGADFMELWLHIATMRRHAGEPGLEEAIEEGRAELREARTVERALFDKSHALHVAKNKAEYDCKAPPPERMAELEELRAKLFEELSAKGMPSPAASMEAYFDAFEEAGASHDEAHRVLLVFIRTENAVRYAKPETFEVKRGDPPPALSINLRELHPAVQKAAENLSRVGQLMTDEELRTLDRYARDEITQQDYDWLVADRSAALGRLNKGEGVSHSKALY